MKTIEMEVALMRYFDIRANLVVPNVSWGLAGLHECDLLVLSKSNYATEIEIKVSKGDLMKDKNKDHGHKHNHIKYLFFAVPEKLVETALEVIPERAGLYVVKSLGPKNRNIERFGVEMARQCEANKLSIKWPEKDRYQLARLGTMRILGLKSKLINYKN